MQQPISNNCNYIIRNKTVVLFYIHGTEVHHSFAMPHKSEQNALKILKIKIFGNVKLNMPIDKSSQKWKTADT
jgi:uncharacterized protein YhhL (DUF1145 family)